MFPLRGIATTRIILVILQVFLVECAHNTEFQKGENWDETIFNVFRKKDGTIRHFLASEMSFAPPTPKQHHRAGDLVDPLWGLLDMTPEGRGDFFPKVNYDIE